jgi:hypothetical protein
MGNVAVRVATAARQALQPHQVLEDIAIPQPEAEQERARQLEIERIERRRHADEALERARLAELEQRRLAEAAEESRRLAEVTTLRRVDDTLLLLRRAALQRFSTYLYALLVLPILYNMITFHHFQGGLVMSVGGLIRISAVPAYTRSPATMCVVAFICEVVGDWLVDVWMPIAEIFHIFGYSAEACALVIILHCVLFRRH